MVAAASVSTVLASRLAAPLGAPLRRFVFVAATLHALIAAGAVFLPALLAKPAKPIEYVAITIVPAARLGVEQPKPAPPPPKPVEEPKPQPEPEPAKAQDAPVLPNAKEK